MLNKYPAKSLFILSIAAIFTSCNYIGYSATPSLNSTASSTIPYSSPTPVLPTDTLFPTPSPTVTVTPTPVWVYVSGTITCPILLYHRIAEPPSPNSVDARYYTPPEDFKWQMEALKDWGYNPIPISLLVAAIMKGALLPPRPVVLSFDDGDETVFSNAYPILQDYGFTGVLYIVGEYIGAQGYMTVDQLKAMTGSGWEIGSHSMSHLHLPANHDLVNFEAGKSKSIISSKIGVTIETFAYPYGEMDPFIVDKVAEYGYFAAVGLGTQYVHNLTSLYYLSRIEVQNGINPATFAALLPWSNQP